MTTKPKAPERPLRHWSGRIADSDVYVAEEAEAYWDHLEAELKAERERSAKLAAFYAATADWLDPSHVAELIKTANRAILKEGADE